MLALLAVMFSAVSISIAASTADVVKDVIAQVNASQFASRRSEDRRGNGRRATFAEHRSNVAPRHLRVTQSLTVNADAVPAGKTIR
jgi:hypothetical protein